MTQMFNRHAFVNVSRRALYPNSSKCKEMLGINQLWGFRVGVKAVDLDPKERSDGAGNTESNMSMS